MRISTAQHGTLVEVIAAGRLDESWADHLATALDGVVRDGTHHVRLNMESVTYLSSAGIRVLVGCYNNLKELNGSFAVTQPSKQVQMILDMTRLSPILIGEASIEAPPSPRDQVKEIPSENGRFELAAVNVAHALTCRVVGDPGAIENGDCKGMTPVAFPVGTFGFGVGAFGANFEECRDRFGEFMAAGGGAAYLPTDGASVPDYLLAAGSLVPEIGVLYGVRCEGNFSHHLRFSAGHGVRDLALSEIVSTCVQAAGSPTVGVVIVAESSGLVGAALRRSPGLDRKDALSPFDFPNVRSWLTFTAEPAQVGTLCCVVGVASTNGTAVDGRLANLLRPLTRAVDPAISGHFHAVAFSYRPLQKGVLELNTTVDLLFENQGPKALLHLLNDSREATGAGESRFVRGACWVGPIREVTAL